MTREEAEWTAIRLRDEIRIGYPELTAYHVECVNARYEVRIQVPFERPETVRGGAGEEASRYQDRE